MIKPQFNLKLMQLKSSLVQNSSYSIQFSLIDLFGLGLNNNYHYIELIFNFN